MVRVLVSAILMIAVAACGSAASELDPNPVGDADDVIEEPEPQWSMDVVYGSCSASDGFFEFAGELTNDGSSVATYSVEVELTDSDTDQRLGTGVANIDSLDPGRTSNWEAVGSYSGDFESARCQVFNVEVYDF